MKKKLLSLVLCFSLLSSLTVSASADFTSSDSSNLEKILNQLQFSATSGTVSNYLKLIYNQLTEIRSELDYPAGSFSSLRALLNAMYKKIGSDSSPNYSTVLNNIKKNTDSLVSTASAIVNSALAAALARRFSRTFTGKQPHRRGGQPHSEISSIMVIAHDNV